MPRKISTIAGAIILLIAVAISGLAIFNNQKNFPVIEQLMFKRIKKNINNSVVKNPELTPKTAPNQQTNYILGTIKDIKKDSFVVTDLSGKDVTVSFDSNTKFLKGEKTGQDATAADLAVDWNVAAVFRTGNLNNNIAQTIHIVSRK